MLIDELREQYKQCELLQTFEMSRSSYNYHRKHANRADPERDRLKAKVIALYMKPAVVQRVVAPYLLN